ncbi:NUDIX hydrolase domain-like protein [Mycena galericulata]|nr:NUDIX hydrolase domain-like protein [Mycena galericulata]
MAASHYPSTQYFSDKFVASAGCVLFRKNESDALEICVLHERNTDEWLLPKGRKDCGEDLAAAAMRETFEETGYPCMLLPCRMPTRAPAPGMNGPDAVALVDGATEPFALTVRDQGDRGVKLVWWFLAHCAPGTQQVEGTQTAWEAFDAVWMPADEAPARLTFAGDQDTVKQAVRIVRDGNEGRV